MYCTCPSLIEVRHSSSLPLPQYIASPKFCTSLVTAPARLRVRQLPITLHFPHEMSEALSKPPNCAPKATAAGFWVCFFCFRPALLPPAPSFLRGLHTGPTSPSYYAIRKAGLHFGVRSLADACSVSEKVLLLCSEHCTTAIQH